MASSFFSRLAQRIEYLNSPLCIGIDPTPDLLSPPYPESALEFSRNLVDATIHAAAAFKVNIAFFEALGPRGWQILFEIVAYIKSKNALVILDAKRADIGSTAQAYARACFDELRVDAVTVNPYMGADTLQPFIRSSPDIAIFVLCKTSNPGSADFQTLPLADGRRVFEAVIDAFKHDLSQTGFVVGATDDEALQTVRDRCADAWILAPGLGFQGGSVLRGDRRILYPVSRGIYEGLKFRENADKFADLVRY